MEELLKKLEIACWAFYHHHIGTANQLNSKNRIYEIADESQQKYGVTNDTLEKICNKAMQ